MLKSTLTKAVVVGALALSTAAPIFAARITLAQYFKTLCTMERDAALDKEMLAHLSNALPMDIEELLSYYTSEEGAQLWRISTDTDLIEKTWDSILKLGSEGRFLTNVPRENRNWDNFMSEIESASVRVAEDELLVRIFLRRYLYSVIKADFDSSNVKDMWLRFKFNFFGEALSVLRKAMVLKSGSKRGLAMVKFHNRNLDFPDNGAIKALGLMRAIDPEEIDGSFVRAAASLQKNGKLVFAYDKGVIANFPLLAGIPNPDFLALDERGELWVIELKDTFYRSNEAHTLRQLEGAFEAMHPETRARTHFAIAAYSEMDSDRLELKTDGTLARVRREDIGRLPVSSILRRPVHFIKLE